MVNVTTLHAPKSTIEDRIAHLEEQVALLIDEADYRVQEAMNLNTCLQTMAVVISSLQSTTE